MTASSRHSLTVRPQAASAAQSKEVLSSGAVRPRSDEGFSLRSLCTGGCLGPTPHRGSVERSDQHAATRATFRGLVKRWLDAWRSALSGCVSHFFVHLVPFFTSLRPPNNRCRRQPSPHFANQSARQQPVLSAAPGPTWRVIARHHRAISPRFRPRSTLRRHTSVRLLGDRCVVKEPNGFGPRADDSRPTAVRCAEILEPKTASDMVNREPVDQHSEYFHGPEHPFGAQLLRASGRWADPERRPISGNRIAVQQGVRHTVVASGAAASDLPGSPLMRLSLELLRPSSPRGLQSRQENVNISLSFYPRLLRRPSLAGRRVIHKICGQVCVKELRATR